MSQADFNNVYDDQDRAGSYAELQFPGTYHLAFRDLPALFDQHVKGRRALDFGCGIGRSTRFLRDSNFEAMGVDISEAMLVQARELDPEGEYRIAGESGLSSLPPATFDLILSTFTFDNIPTRDEKLANFMWLRNLLSQDGTLVSLVSSPEIYWNEWASFSTKNYPQNLEAKSGERVLIEMLDVKDRRPVEDVIFDDASYREIYRELGLCVAQVHKPLATGEEGIDWVSEKEIAPWTIYVLKHQL